MKSRFEALTKAELSLLARATASLRAVLIRSDEELRAARTLEARLLGFLDLGKRVRCFTASAAGRHLYGSGSLGRSRE